MSNPRKFDDDTSKNLSKNKHIEKSMFGELWSALSATMIYEPNLSYIGMNQAINLGTEFFSQECNKSPNNIYISSGLTRTITTALLALRFVPNAVILVVPFISETTKDDNDDIQNIAVSSEMLKKKILFIKNWLEENWIIRFDDIEIINFLITIYKNINITNKEMIKIKNNIHRQLQCRKSEICRKKYSADLQNLVMELIKNFNDLTFNKMSKYDNSFILTTYDKLSAFSDKINIFKRGPLVDFTFYKFYEEKYSKYKNLQKPENIGKRAELQRLGTMPTGCPNPHLKEIDYFFNHVLLKIFKYVKQSKDIDTHTLVNSKIYAFAHGDLIKKLCESKNKTRYEELYDKLDNMPNTMVVSNTITIDIVPKDITIKNFNFDIIHEPSNIRSKYYYFEHYNENVCRRESVKGIINYPLGELGKRGHALDLENYPSTEDVSFYYKNPEKYDSEIVDIYSQKYLKYKKKYLNLKKIIFNAYI